MCEVKAQYATAAIASRVARKANGRTGGELIAPYFCARHDCWHLGHPPMSRRLSEDRKRRRRR